MLGGAGRPGTIIDGGTAAQTAVDGPNAWVTTMTEKFSRRARNKNIN